MTTVITGFITIALAYIQKEEYENLQNHPSVTWICPTCEIMNFSDSFFDHSTEITTKNKFSILQPDDATKPKLKQHEMISHLLK